MRGEAGVRGARSSRVRRGRGGERETERMEVGALPGGRDSRRRQINRPERERAEPTNDLSRNESKVSHGSHGGDGGRGRRRHRPRRRPAGRGGNAPASQTPPQIDYPRLWQDAYDQCKQLDSSNRIDDAITYLELLTSFLENVALDTSTEDISFVPPPAPPPAAHNQDQSEQRGGGGSFRVQGSVTRQTTATLQQNIYSILDEGGNDDIEENNNLADRVEEDSTDPLVPRKIYLVKIEFYTYLGELKAKKAGTIRRQHNITWSQGAEYFKSSCELLLKAFEVVCLHDLNEDVELTVMKDGVSLACEFCSSKLQEYEQKAELRRSRILERLNPQLRERDHMRDNVIGEERWKNNPSPRLDYAERRRLLEEELKDLNTAIDELVETKNKYLEIQSAAEEL